MHFLSFRYKNMSIAAEKQKTILENQKEHIRIKRLHKEMPLWIEIPNDVSTLMSEGRQEKVSEKYVRNIRVDTKNELQMQKDPMFKNRYI